MIRKLTSDPLGAVAVLLCAVLAAIFLYQTARNALHPSDTGHAAYIGLRLTICEAP